MIKKDGKSRIGVYVCHCGGNISEVVDVKEVTAFAARQADVVMAKDYSHMCSELGQKMILDDVKAHQLDRVVIAACSPQFQGGTFMKTLETAGLSPYVLEMANIREQCAWPHYDFPEGATEKAKDLTAMAIAKVREDESLQKKMMPIGKRVLIIGAGIAGIQAALDLGDAGFTVHLVEKAPSIGGKMAQLSRTFPTEDCAACILSPKMADVPANPNIDLLTYSEVEKIEGYLGNFKVTVKKKPRYIDPTRCTACGICEEKCPVKVKDEFEENLTIRKATYIPFGFAVPYKNLIDENACLRILKGGKVCGLCERFCPGNAVDFSQKPEFIEFTVDTIIVATGFDIFDARQKSVYGYGKYPNVLSALEMERMIVHESEGAPLRDLGKRIAFIQCVGSRDEQVGNEYCSRICCMYATKLASLLKHARPERDIYVFYTDLRAYGKGFEEYYKRSQNMGIKFIRGRVAEVMDDADNPQQVTLKVEDTLTRQIIQAAFDTVVLSVGLRPNQGTEKIAAMLKLAKSPDGFLQEAHPKFRPVDTLTDGVFVAGTAQGPKDIPDTVAQASAASSRAIRLMNRGEYALDPIMAFVHEDLCDGCGLCVDKCPVHAISLDGRRAVINEALCKGCGSCIGACPRDALDLHVYTNAQLLGEIESLTRTRKKGETKFLVFTDDATAYRLCDNVGTAKLAYSLNSRIIRVPSCSRISAKLMLHALAAGIDGILLGESEAKSSPYPHAIPEIAANAARVNDILHAEEIGARVEFVQFFTVMLAGFVKKVNALDGIIQKSGPIPDDKRRALSKRL
ncbi:MAG: FAD-dependent oxidoreductase [Acidobacteriota bacterium]|nr:FAD-dependent oxidoreductase [Acidobacteriota bacterium]